jgi:hypothetical protein
MRGSLGMLNYERYARLLKAAPRDIRADILGRKVQKNLFVVGEKWTDRAVDVQVGDLILLPSGTRYEAENLRVVEETEATVLLTATAPGMGRVYHPRSGWAAFVRVSRRNYVGLGPYRHWEDPDYEAEDGWASSLPGREQPLSGLGPRLLGGHGARRGRDLSAMRDGERFG